MQSNNWIKVSDEVPNNSRQVLITYKWDENDYEVSLGEFWDIDINDENYGFGKFHKNVIAWMEKPEPFMENENAE